MYIIVKQGVEGRSTVSVYCCCLVRRLRGTNAFQGFQNRKLFRLVIRAFVIQSVF